MIFNTVALGAQFALAAEADLVVTAGPQFRSVTMAPDRPTSGPLIASVERALSRYAAGCGTHDENAVAARIRDYTPRVDSTFQLNLAEE
ncbi:MAG: hypothetical protein WA642_02590 [Steroidobacteraceae bacterium]